MPNFFTKDPDAILDYMNDWSFWLNGDTIKTSTWIPDAGITVVSSAKSDTTATVFLSGGSVNTVYAVINRITTLADRTDDRTIRFMITEK